MNRLRRCDRFAHRRFGKTSRCTFYFGKFGHGIQSASRMCGLDCANSFAPLGQRPLERITEGIAVRFERIEHVHA